jgi:hypothetical protein
LTIKTPLTAALAALSLSCAAPTFAQEAETPSKDTPQEAMPEVSTEDVTDKQIEEFTAAYMAVSKVRAEYMPKIAEEQNAEARQALIEEANTAVVDAVKEVTEMDAKTYVAIGKAAESDQALNERITARIKAAQSE